MQKSCSSEVTYGGFFARLAAYLIDKLIVGAGLLIVRLVLLLVGGIFSGEALSAEILFTYSLKDIILYLCGVLYFIMLTYYTGTTLGKRAMNLRVVKADGSRLSLFDVIYRETVGRFLCGLFLCIGYLMVGVDSKKRGLHDFLCDTVVVYEKKVKVTNVYAQMPVYPTAGPVPNQVPPQRNYGQSVPPQGQQAPSQYQQVPPQYQQPSDGNKQEGVPQHEERGL